MGLAATGSICSLFARRVAFGLCRRSVCTYAKRMRMARHLGFREGRGADSAGNTRSWSRSPATPAGLGGPHDVRKCIVRRQGGRFPRGSVQRVCMRLGASSGVYIATPLPPVADCRCTSVPASVGVAVDGVRMAGQLPHGEGRGPDSAG